MFRVPLLFPSAIVVSRLSITETRRIDPDGAGPLTSGYDPDFREPYLYSDSEVAKTTERWEVPIRIPCQVETMGFEELNKVFGGNAPNSRMVFILHNRTLASLDLLPRNSQCGYGSRILLNTGDRIDAIEKAGVPGYVIQSFQEPLYIHRIDPASWGMGEGFDLHYVFTQTYPATPKG